MELQPSGQTTTPEDTEAAAMTGQGGDVATGVAGSPRQRSVASSMARSGGSGGSSEPAGSGGGDGGGVVVSTSDTSLVPPVDSPGTTATTTATVSSAASLSPTASAEPAQSGATDSPAGVGATATYGGGNSSAAGVVALSGPGGGGDGGTQSDSASGSDDDIVLISKPDRSVPQGQSVWFSDRQPLPFALRYIGYACMYIAALAWLRVVQSTQQSTVTVLIKPGEGVSALWSFAAFTIVSAGIASFALVRYFFIVVDRAELKIQAKASVAQIEALRKQVFVTGTLVAWIGDAMAYIAVASLNSAVVASIPSDEPGLAWVYWVVCMILSAGVVFAMHVLNTAIVKAKSLTSQVPALTVMIMLMTAHLAVLIASAFNTALVGSLMATFGNNTGALAGTLVAYFVIATILVPVVNWYLDYPAAPGLATQVVKATSARDMSSNERLAKAKAVVSITIGSFKGLPSMLNLVIIRTLWWLPALSLFNAILAVTVVISRKADTIQTVPAGTLMVIFVVFTVGSTTLLFFLEVKLLERKPADVRMVATTVLGTPDVSNRSVKQYLFWARVNDMVSRSSSRVSSKLFDASIVLYLTSSESSVWILVIYAIVATLVTHVVVLAFARVVPDSITLVNQSLVMQEGLDRIGQRRPPAAP